MRRSRRWRRRLAELGAGGLAIPEASFEAPWPPPDIAVRRWQDGAWGCSRRICLIPDVGDADGDPATAVVLFDRGFGHASSPLQRDGHPVFQLLVTAESGESRQAIVAEVVPVTCAPSLAAAWTAAGPLDLIGDIRVAGTDTVPAVAGRSTARLFEGAVVDGRSVSDPELALPAGVLQILNAGGTLTRLDELPEPPAGGRLDGLFWSRGQHAGRSGRRGDPRRAQPGLRPRAARGFTNRAGGRPAAGRVRPGVLPPRPVTAARASRDHGRRVVPRA